MPCGSGFDQIVLKGPYMNQDLGLQLDDGNRFPFCNPPKECWISTKMVHYFFSAFGSLFILATYPFVQA